MKWEESGLPLSIVWKSCAALGRCRKTLYAFALAGVCPLALTFGQQLKPSVQAESLTGSTEFVFDTQGAITAAAFVETSTQGVFVAISNDGTLTWATPTQVDSAAAGVTRRLLRDGVQVRGDEVHLAWIESSSNGTDSVHVARSSDGGFQFGPPVLVSGSVGPGVIPDGVLAVQDDSPIDDIQVLFRLDSGTGKHELYMASSDPSLVDTFLFPVIVRASSGSDVEGMDLSQEGTSLFVAWVDDRNGDDDLWFRRSINRGSSWVSATDIRLDSGGIPGAAVQPDVRVFQTPATITTSGGGVFTKITPTTVGGAGGGSGILWVLWREDATVPGRMELRSRVSLNLGVSLQGVTVVGSYVPGLDHVAAFDAQLSPTAGFLVAWEDDRSGPSGIYAARSGTDGSAWLFETNLSSVTAVDPTLVLDKGGTAGVAWTEPGVVPLVGGAFSLDSGLSWSPPIMVSAGAPGSASEAVVGYNPACENMIQLWLDDAGGSPNVYAGGYLVGACKCFLPGGTVGNGERVYTPAALLPGLAHQTLTVFYPEPPFVKPAEGWPVVLYSPAGAFASAAAIGTEASSLPALCGEPPTTSTTGNGLGLKLLTDALQSGWAVITVGTIGWNSPKVPIPMSINVRDPNLFFDQGSSEWNVGDTFWGEQEFTWARQYVALFAEGGAGTPSLEVDNDRVVVCGTSTGAIYSAFVALGPDRRDLGSSDSQLNQSTHSAGAILFESPSWFPGYDANPSSLLPGLHWPELGSTTQRADLLSDADPADLRADSISTWIRSAGSMAVDTPVFLAFDESMQSLDFARAADCSLDPVGADPSLTSVLNLFVHDTWFGLIAYEDLLCIDGSFHTGQSRLWIDAAVDIGPLPSPQSELPTGTFTGGVQGDELQDKALDWLLGQRASTPVRNTVGTDTSFNPSCYATLSAPVLGGTWRAQVDVTTHPGATTSTLLTYGGVFAAPLMHLGFAIYVNILFAPIDVDFAVPAGGSALHENPIPQDTSLLGLTLYTQAAILGGGLEVCNGIDLVFGY